MCDTSDDTWHVHCCSRSLPNGVLTGGSAKDVTRKFYTVNKRITTPFRDNITFTLILIRSQTNVSSYCNLTHISSQIFTSLILNCAPIGKCKVVAIFTSKINNLIGERKYFVRHFG
jgi:hypothetical protein